MTVQFEVSSEIGAPARAVLATLDMSGVNAELAPWVRMTAPRQWRLRPIFDWPTEQILFTSTLLLFGVLPIDRHRFLLLEVDGDRGFVEQSSSWSHRRWRHERRVESLADGTCRVTDRIAADGRVPGLTRLLRPLLVLLFRHRHRRLSRRVQQFVDPAERRSTSRDR